MVDQTVKVENLDGGKHRVAFDMARDMWFYGHDRDYPKSSDADEFLVLLEKCLRTLNIQGVPKK